MYDAFGSENHTFLSCFDNHAMMRSGAADCLLCQAFSLLEVGAGDGQNSRLSIYQNRDIVYTEFSRKASFQNAGQPEGEPGRERGWAWFCGGIRGKSG